MKDPKNCLDGLTFKTMTEALEYAGLTTGRSHKTSTGSNGAANNFLKSNYEISYDGGISFKSK